MKRIFTLFVVASLLLVPTMGSANPNGVGDGTFDAQCGGACHGDADMNRSSASTVTVSGPSTAYEGLPTSVDVTVSNIETTVSGLLGIFLLSDLSGAGDTPADDGWTIVSNSEGGTQNYVEVLVEPGQTEHTVSWTLRAPTTGSYGLHAAIHHGTQDGSEAPFFGATIEPIEINVVPVPEALPRGSPAFGAPGGRAVGGVTRGRVSAQAGGLSGLATSDWGASSHGLDGLAVSAAGGASSHAGGLDGLVASEGPSSARGRRRRAGVSSA